MERRGEVAVSTRENRQRLWDLADRVYPDVTPVAADEAESRRDARRLTSLGIARSKGPVCPAEPVDVGGATTPSRSSTATASSASSTRPRTGTRESCASTRSTGTSSPAGRWPTRSTGRSTAWPSSSSSPWRGPPDAGADRRTGSDRGALAGAPLDVGPGTRHTRHCLLVGPRSDSRGHESSRHRRTAWVSCRLRRVTVGQSVSTRGALESRAGLQTGQGASDARGLFAGDGCQGESRPHACRTGGR